MIYICLTLLLFAADLISKIIAKERLMDIGSIPVIKDIFHLTYVENRGIAFGMLSGGRIFFIIMTIIVLAVLFAIVAKTPKTMRTVWLKAGGALVTGGAVGNMIDRVIRGYVVDFLDFRIIDFPVFNIADIAVCVGAVMLVIHFLKAEDKVNE